MGERPPAPPAADQVLNLVLVCTQCLRPAALLCLRALTPARPPLPPPRSGALLERVESRAYSERYIARLIRDVLRFIAQCHAKGLVYRDVKPGARAAKWGAGRGPVGASAARTSVTRGRLGTWLHRCSLLPPSLPSPGLADNFLFLTKQDDSPLKATDFGLSIRHSADEPKLTSRSGTPAYMAPELVMQSYGAWRPACGVRCM